MIFSVYDAVDQRMLSHLTVCISLFGTEKELAHILRISPNSEVRALNEKGSVDYRLHSLDIWRTVVHEQRGPEHHARKRCSSG